MARKKQKSAKGGAPISSHPAFPAIVALWFAALFGIGSLVLPIGLFEGAVTATGVDAAVPAAAPPLGFTARAAIAILAGLVGLAAGLVLARKVAAAQSGSKERSRDLKLNDEDRHPDAPAKRPISARKELGSEGLGPVEDPWKFEDEWAEDEDNDDGGFDASDFESDDFDDPENGEGDRPQVKGQVANRRRSLSVTDDSGRSDFLNDAPLPGRTPEDMLELDILEEEPREDELASQEFAEEISQLQNTQQDAFVADKVAVTEDVAGEEPFGGVPVDNQPMPFAKPEENASVPAEAAPFADEAISFPPADAAPARDAPPQIVA